MNECTRVDVEDVTKIIKGKIVLQDINLSFASGRVYGIKGYNGSGKTMLMRVIAGLIFPTKGRVLINGEPVEKTKKVIGLMIENPAFLDSYTGFGNLKLLASIQNLISDERIWEVLHIVGLSEHKKLKYKKYSLGMKQRLGIGAAIMEKPDILLLDEPINGLDEKGVMMMAEIIRKEKERGALVILSCHEESFLKAASDEIYLIENGSIVLAEA